MRYKLPFRNKIPLSFSFFYLVSLKEGFKEEFAFVLQVLMKAKNVSNLPRIDILRRFPRSVCLKHVKMRLENDEKNPFSLFDHPQKRVKRTYHFLAPGSTVQHKLSGVKLAWMDTKNQALSHFYVNNGDRKAAPYPCVRQVKLIRTLFLLFGKIIIIPSSGIAHMSYFTHKKATSRV